MTDPAKTPPRTKATLTGKAGVVIVIGDIVLRFHAGRRVTIERPIDQAMTIEQPPKPNSGQ